MKAQIFTHLLYRHWSAYKEGRRKHIFVVPVSIYSSVNGKMTVSTPPNELSPDGNTPRDLTPGDYDAPVFSLGGQDDYAFSPDGKEICYASNHDPEPAISTNNDLFTVPVDFPPGATPEQVLAATKESPPTTRPATRRRSIRRMESTSPTARSRGRDMRATSFRLMLYDRKTGKKHSLTEGFDQWVGIAS